MAQRSFVNSLIRRAIPYFLLLPLAVAQSTTSNGPAKKALTIEAIFAAGGITGRPPETIQWTADSTKFTFIQRDDSGTNGELWSADANTGVKTLLLSQSKLATLAPSPNKITDERELERITRYRVDPYHW